MASETTGDLTVRAPAKLNLGLAVVGKRGDGYHDLHTIFQAIDLSDTLHFRKKNTPGIRLTVSGPQAVSDGPDNLVVRAGTLLGSRLGVDFGAEIHLVKHIPIEAGLGGGSSDAAATVIGLESLWQKELGEDERLRLALDLGSDVPFFLTGGTARGEGRGEILTPLPPPPSAAWVLVIPPFPMSTPEAFRGYAPSLTSHVANLRMLEAACISGDFEAFVENIVNSLEVGVVRIQPRLAQIKKELLARGAAGVGLTGSGSALFAVFRSQGTADQLLDEGVPSQGVRILSCNPVDFGAMVVPRPV